MRIHYILFILALVAATACNQMHTTDSDAKNSADSSSTSVDTSSTAVDSLSLHETIDSSYATKAISDPLTYWDSVYIHDDLVKVARQICRMDSINSGSPNIDFFVKSVERFNPKLVAYYDRHHRSKNISKDQKIESVLNEIKVTYRHLVDKNASTPFQMEGLNVYNAVDLYREFFLFNRMERLAQNKELRAALRDEMKQWRSLELDLTSYVTDVTSMLCTGGSIKPVACLSAYQLVLDSRVEDQNNLSDLLFEKKSLKSKETLKHAEKVFHLSLKSALNNALSENHINGDERDDQYVEEYQKALRLQKDIKKSLSQWLKARERLAIVANVPQEECQRVSAAFLAKLSKGITIYVTE